MGGTIRGLTWIGLLFIHQSEGARVRGCRCHGSVIGLVYLMMDHSTLYRTENVQSSHNRMEFYIN